MECQKEKNLERCTCTAGCQLKGMCCECVAKHRAINQVPGCFFTQEGEKTWDRSIENYIKLAIS